MAFYLAAGDRQSGPFTLEQLQGQGLRADTLVWREGMADWQAAGTLPELRPVLFGHAAEHPSTSLSAAPAPQPLPVAGDAPAATSPLAYHGTRPGEPVPSAGLAIASMVLGILSIPLFCIWWLSGPMAILAVVLGHIAYGQARRGQAAGAGMAMAGMICGYVTLGIVVLIVVLFAGALLIAGIA